MSSSLPVVSVKPSARTWSFGKTDEDRRELGERELGVLLQRELVHVEEDVAHVQDETAGRLLDLHVLADGVVQAGLQLLLLGLHAVDLGRHAGLVGLGRVRPGLRGLELLALLLLGGAQPRGLGRGRWSSISCTLRRAAVPALSRARLE